MTSSLKPETPISGTIYIASLDSDRHLPEDDLLLVDHDAVIVSIGSDYGVYPGHDSLGRAIIVISKTGPPAGYPGVAQEEEAA